jgi:hypothetical protein
VRSTTGVMRWSNSARESAYANDVPAASRLNVVSKLVGERVLRSARLEHGRAPQRLIEGLA